MSYARRRLCIALAVVFAVNICLILTVQNALSLIHI